MAIDYEELSREMKKEALSTDKIYVHRRGKKWIVRRKGSHRAKGIFNDRYSAVDLAKTFLSNPEINFIIILGNNFELDHMIEKKPNA